MADIMELVKSNLGHSLTRNMPIIILARGQGTVSVRYTGLMDSTECMLLLCRQVLWRFRVIWPVCSVA